MRVSRIEIFGFKSFMDRTILPLEGGLTGVVGPNGCGKSNIVDAIRWVLGETRAKSLRGANFEDVIFNGTDKLRPLGLAEVTMTIKAKSESFFDEMLPSLLNDEVAESLARIDEAEEALDKKDDTKKSNVIPFQKLGKEGEEIVEISKDLEDTKENDIEEIMREASLGSIEDEAINLNLNNENPQNINCFSNENSDIENQEIQNQNNVNQDSENSENNNDNDLTLLSRFSWLKATKEVQVTRRLYRSGESEYFINRVPCRLKDLKELFRAIGIGARAYTIVAQNEVTRIIAAKPEEKRQMIEEAAGVNGFKERIACANKRLEDTLTNVSRLDDIIHEVTRNVNSLKRQSQRARDRKGLLDRLKEVDLMLFKDSYLSNSKSLEEFKNKKELAIEAEVATKNAMDVIKVKEEAIRLGMVESDSEADNLRLKIDAIKDELNTKERKLNEIKSRLQEKKVRQESLDLENKRLEDRKISLQKREEEEKAELGNLEAQRDELKVKLDSIENVGEDDLKKASVLVEETKTKLHEKERELKKAHEIFISTKVRLESVEEQLISASPVSQLKKTLGNHFSQDEFIVQARNARLFIDGISVNSKYAKALQSVLGEKAEFLISKEPEKLISSFTKMASSSNKKGLGVGIFKEGENNENALEDGENISLKSFLSLVEVKPEFSLVVNSILKNVYVCETLFEGQEFFKNYNGKNINDICLVTLEGEILTNYSFYSLKHEGGLVQLKTKKEELQKEFDEISKTHEALSAEKTVLFEDARRAEIGYREALDNLRKRQQEVREVSNRLANVKGKLEARKRLVMQCTMDIERLTSQFQDIERRREIFTSEIKALEEQLSDAQAFDQSELRKELLELDGKYKLANENRNKRRFELSSFNEELDEARKKHEASLREVNKIELDLQKSRYEIDNIEKIVLEKYDRSDLSFVIKQDETSQVLNWDERSSLKNELEKIKARIFREGEVDPTSIERYEEERLRLEGLEEQRKDLDKAVNVLNKAISRLVETSQIRFMNVFTKVKEHFSSLAPKLFGGGSADLVLSDETKPLESGVDIVARPPGKKLKSLELLSGGEKTLCAIALILATFLERPSPLCILDEVDAPLDEANLMRFLKLMQDLSTKTQVVMITHNKQSMIASDSLIGVTMQEPGATKLLSVSLDDAISQAV